MSSCFHFNNIDHIATCLESEPISLDSNITAVFTNRAPLQHLAIQHKPKLRRLTLEHIRVQKLIIQHNYHLERVECVKNCTVDELFVRESPFFKRFFFTQYPNITISKLEKSTRFLASKPDCLGTMFDNDFKVCVSDSPPHPPTCFTQIILKRECSSIVTTECWMRFPKWSHTNRCANDEYRSSLDSHLQSVFVQNINLKHSTQSIFYIWVGLSITTLLSFLFLFLFKDKKKVSFSYIVQSLAFLIIFLVLRL